MGYSSARSVLTLTRLRLRRFCSTLYPGFTLRRHILSPLSIASICYVTSMTFSGFYLVVFFTLLPQMRGPPRMSLFTIPSLLLHLFFIINMVFSYILTAITDPGRVPATWKVRAFQLEYPSKPNVPVPVLPPPSDSVAAPSIAPADPPPSPRQLAHSSAASSSPPSAAAPHTSLASGTASTVAAVNISPSVVISFQPSLASPSEANAETDAAISTQSPQDRRSARKRGRSTDFPAEVTVAEPETEADRCVHSDQESTSKALHASPANTTASCTEDNTQREKSNALGEDGECPQRYPAPPNEVWAAGTMMRRGDGRFRYCASCEAFKPDRAHHCTACNSCILLMDHHCPFVGDACVGVHNRKFFVLFLYYASFSSWTVTFISWRTVFQFMFIEFPTSNNHPELQWIEHMYPIGGPVILRLLVGMSYLLITIHALALTPFTAYHFSLVLRNRTTIETTYSPATRMHKEVLVNADRDYKTHWAMAFGKVPWAWFLPISFGRDPEVDGLRWHPSYQSSTRPDHPPARLHGVKGELGDRNIQMTSSGIDRGSALV